MPALVQVRIERLVPVAGYGVLTPGAVILTTPEMAHTLSLLGHGVALISAESTFTTAAAVCMHRDPALS